MNYRVRSHTAWFVLRLRRCPRLLERHAHHAAGWPHRTRSKSKLPTASLRVVENESVVFAISVLQVGDGLERARQQTVSARRRAARAHRSEAQRDWPDAFEKRCGDGFFGDGKRHCCDCEIVELDYGNSVATRKRERPSHDARLPTAAPSVARVVTPCRSR